MAETKQIAFDLKELASALIKYHGIHEGVWMAGVEFGLTSANFGPSPEETKPSMVIQISKVLLIREEPGHPPALLVDASKVNPSQKFSKPVKPSASS